LEQLLSTLNISTSPALNAGITLLVFLVLAKIADIIASQVLKRFAKRTKNTIDDNIIQILHRPVYLSVALLGVILSAEILGPPAKVIFYIRAASLTIIAMLWAMASLRMTTKIVEGMLKLNKDETGLSNDVFPLIENLTKIAVFIASVMAVLSIWKVNITPLLASAGIMGAAVAFAAKDTIGNLFGGVSVFMDKPFKVGDYIVLDQGERGEVVNIGLRSTRIKTRDNVQIVVPNAIIANSKITNESAPIPSFRIRVPIGVAYGSDIDLVQSAMVDIAVANKNITNDPEPRVRFRQFGDSALNFELLAWVHEPALRGLTTHEINVSLYHKFIELNINIPFPQRDVHLIKE
jgi:MscS family membrane protein